MKSSRRGTLFLGIPSLFLIFAVLTMVTLALMTYGTARSNYQSNATALGQTLSYYDACSTASQYTEELTEKLSALQAASPDEAAFAAALPELSERELLWNAEAEAFELLLPYSESQGLHVLLRPRFSGESVLAIEDWSSVLTSDWSPDTTFKLFTPNH